MSDNKSKRAARSRPAVPALVDPMTAADATETTGIAHPPVAPAPAIDVPQPTIPSTAVPQRAGDLFAAGRTALDALADSQTAMARGFEAMAIEATALARSGFSAAADASSAMLGARTLADAIEIQAGFARRSIDAALDGSARLSEIAVRSTAEASRPILARLDEAWRG